MTSILSIEESIETYVQEHHVEELVQEMLEAIVANRPDNVPRFVVELLIQRYGVQIGKAVVEPSTDFSRTDPGVNPWHNVRSLSLSCRVQLLSTAQQ